MSGNEQINAVWPEWLRGIDPSLAASLDQIHAISQDLRSKTKSGLSYRHVCQNQINAVTDKMIIDGVLTKENFDTPYGRARKFVKPAVTSRSFLAASINNQGVCVRVFDSMTFTSQYAVLRLLDGLRRSIQVGDLLVAMICARSTIEHVAHFNWASNKLKGFAVPQTFNEANKIWGEILAVVTKSNYGSRVNWLALAEGDVDAMIEGNDIEYEQRSNRADQKAISIMNEIDALAKQIPGTRAVYEILCEFAHPNVGCQLLFIEHVCSENDPAGFMWIEKRLGPNQPGALFNSSVQLPRRLFKQLQLCLEHFQTLHLQASGIRTNILAITQIITKRSVDSNRRLFNLYSPCPCGSGKKLKFCCAKAN